jgi:hypothetical protein
MADKPTISLAHWNEWEQTMIADGTRPLVIKAVRDGFTILGPVEDVSGAVAQAAKRPATPSRSVSADVAEVREMAASLIAQGQSQADAEANARRSVAYRRGELDIEDMTSAEAAAQLGELIKDDPGILTRERAYGADLTDEAMQSLLDAQEARHLSSRVQRVRTPFEDAHREDVLRYGADSPYVMSVEDRLSAAIVNAKDDATRAPYQEALAHKPAPVKSLFADVEGAE